MPLEQPLSGIEERKKASHSLVFLVPFLDAEFKQEELYFCLVL